MRRTAPRNGRHQWPEPARPARTRYFSLAHGHDRYHRSMSPVLLAPGAVPLAAWRDIYRGASVALDPAAYGAIDRSARAVASILARGEPVYGINTGFGKLASVRIEPADLEKL